MNKKKANLLLLAATVIFLGAIIFVGAMTALDWDLGELSSSKYETNAHEISLDFENMYINTDTARIVFELSEKDERKVVCYEAKNEKHEVSVSDGTLNISLNSTKKWYEHIGFNFSTPKITVYIPAGEYGALTVRSSTGDVALKGLSFDIIDMVLSTGDVNCSANATKDIRIKTSTGDISLENASARDVELSVSTGRVDVANVKCSELSVRVSTGKTHLASVECDNFTTSGSTGDINLSGVIVNGKIDVKRSTGDIKLTKCDAAELAITTDTGDVRGSLLTDKVFIARSDTGKIDVPKSTSGGICEITTDTGNIIITVD
ncbi:MAG: DUF4097 family beta strand repeat protein [Clostridia bacterium]|nr:DUF4097 family beta strand repeat protein [Clostridia bacterium]